MSDERSLRRDTGWLKIAVAIALGVVAMWAAFSRVVAPRLIGLLYEERGPAFLNRALAGRDVTPIEEYLDTWIAWVGTADLVLGAIIAACIAGGYFRVGTRMARSQARVEERERDVGARMAGPLETVRLAATAGLINGALVGIYMATAGFGFGKIVARFRAVSPDVIWMAPLADVVSFTVIGALLALLGIGIRHLRSRRVVICALASLAIFCLLTLFEILEWYAVVILALAVGVNVGRRINVAGAAARKGARRLVAGLVIWIPVALLLTSAARSIQIRRAIDALPPAPADAPNVLLLILDTVRSENTSLHGYARPTTPNIERLASEGAMFERAIAPAPWTLPTHASLLTGHYNVTLGTDFATPLDRTYATLPEIMSRRGYLTVASVANLVFITKLFGMDRGFAVFDAHPRSPGQVLMSSYLSRYLLPKLKGLFGDHTELVQKRGPEVNREFLAAVDRAPDRPFFAMLNYFDAHAPYNPPDRSMYWDRPGEPRYWIDSDGTYIDEDLEGLIATYDAGITYADASVAALLDSLAARGQLENTLVIVTADHGESFDEHGVIEHAQSLYMDEVHVPLVIRFPGRVPGGSRVEEPVSLRDIPRTVLDLVGEDAGSIPGEPLSRFWERGDVSEGRLAAGVLSELRRKKALTQGNYQLITGPPNEVYDLRADPEQQNDLNHDGGSERADRMLSELEALLDAESEMATRARESAAGSGR